MEIKNQFCSDILLSLPADDTMQKYIQSIAILLLAASVAYLGYAILALVRNMPAILFTGIFQAPFQLMKGVGKEIIPGNLGLSTQDYELVEKRAAAMLAQASVYDKQSFYNGDKSLRFDTELEKEIRKDQRLCRQLSIHVFKRLHRNSKGTFTACLKDDGSWIFENH